MLKATHALTALAALLAMPTAQASVANHDLTPWVLDVMRIDRGEAPEMDWSRMDAPDADDIRAKMNERSTLSGPELTLESDDFVLHYTLEGDDAVTQEQADVAFEAISFSWNQ